MVFFNSRISPFASTVILRDRSPFAMAVATSAMLRTWPVRFDPIELTLSVRSFQVPATSGTSACPPSLPSVPTSRATRLTSEAKAFSWSTIVLPPDEVDKLMAAASDSGQHGHQDATLILLA